MQYPGKDTARNCDCVWYSTQEWIQMVHLIQIVSTSYMSDTWNYSCHRMYVSLCVSRYIIFWATPLKTWIYCEKLHKWTLMKSGREIDGYWTYVDSGPSAQCCIPRTCSYTDSRSSDQCDKTKGLEWRCGSGSSRHCTRQKTFEEEDGHQRSNTSADSPGGEPVQW